jgi:hypothetical protein
MRAKSLSGYKELFNKVKVMAPLLEFTESPLRLRENISKAIDINDGEIKRMRPMQRALVILAGLSERTMMVTSWMPTFRDDFKEATGVAFDMRAFKNDKEYRQKYGKAIRDAAAAADAQTEKIIGTTTKAGQRREIRISPKFLAGLLGKEGTVSKNTTAGQILGFLSNYPYREITEFLNGFREAAEVFKSKGALVSLGQLSKSLAVVINVAAYGYLSAVSQSLWRMLLGDDEEEEKAKKKLDNLLTLEGAAKEFGYNFLSLAGSKYSAGGKAMMQLGATIAINGPTTPAQKAIIADILKESTYLKPLPTDPTDYRTYTELLKTPTQYIPQFVLLADRAMDIMGGKEEMQYLYNKASEKGISALTEDEGARILIASNLINSVQIGANLFGTSIPMYSKIKMGMRTLKKEAGVDKISGGEIKEAKGYGENNQYKTIKEYKIADPVGYYKAELPGGELYEKRAENKEKNKASEETKKNELIEKYGEEAYLRAQPTSKSNNRAPRFGNTKGKGKGKTDSSRSPRQFGR